MITSDKVQKRLRRSGISLYRIAKLIDEPESTVCNFFSGVSKYSESRGKQLLGQIYSAMLLIERASERVSVEQGTQGVEGNEGTSIEKASERVRAEHGLQGMEENVDTYTKLYEIGLNSKAFTPEEKLHLAIMHKKLQTLKKEKEKKNEGE